MARIFSFIIILIVIILGLYFGSINADPVNLNYFWGTRQIPLSLALVLSLFCGALLGVLVSLGMMIRLRHQLTQLRRTIKTAEQELSNLRAIPLKDRD